jgi:sugar phosphate isomerase/epimerase
LTLTALDAMEREAARQFIRRMIDFGGIFAAPAIVGSMQGRATEGMDRDEALRHLRNGLDELADHAARYNVPLLYEPLNRYETNLCNNIDQGVELIASMRSGNVKLLADLFHMNIEESDIPAALRRGWKNIGHLHFADSNRRPVGYGHTDIPPIVAALHDIGYGGYASAEVFPWPDPRQAAAMNMESFNLYFHGIPRPRH